ncbi:MAG: adenosylcobinamide amidohydrolase [Acidobacteriota bacterium]
MTAKPYELAKRERWLVAEFPEPWTVLSWAVVNGGWQQTAKVAWLFLKLNEISFLDDPAAWMRGQMRTEGLSDAVGFLTSRRAHCWVEAEAEDGACRAWAVGTVGMSNARRAGDAADSLSATGTINQLVCCSLPLTTEAALEVLALTSEAKALAAVESGVRSGKSNLPCTGTGTDYLALAWPAVGVRQQYGGKHTSMGAAAGRAACELVTKGIRIWREENPQAG